MKPRCPHCGHEVEFGELITERLGNTNFRNIASGKIHKGIWYHPQKGAEWLLLACSGLADENRYLETNDKITCTTCYTRVKK